MVRAGGERAVGGARISLREAVEALRGRREDPFAALQDDPAGTSGWMEAWILECAGRGSCPACEAERAAREAYLLWLPTNVCDTRFLEGLEETGGFCGRHFVAALATLRRFPYRQVRLLGLMRRRLEKGKAPFADNCDLCASMEESGRACLAMCREMARLEERRSPAGRGAIRFCRRHGGSSRQEGEGAVAGRGQEPSSPSTGHIGMHAEGRPSGRDLLAALHEVTGDYHVRGTEELRSALRRCEGLISRLSGAAPSRGETYD